MWLAGSEKPVPVREGDRFWARIPGAISGVALLTFSADGVAARRLDEFSEFITAGMLSEPIWRQPGSAYQAGLEGMLDSPEPLSRLTMNGAEPLEIYMNTGFNETDEPRDAWARMTAYQPLALYTPQ